MMSPTPMPSAKRKLPKPRGAPLCALKMYPNLPAAEHGVGHARRVVSIPAAVAIRHLDETARDERMLAIPLADDALQRRVEVVEITGLRHRARPGVGDLHRETVRHPALDSRLQRVVVGLTIGLGRLHGRELRIWTKQLAARHVRSRQPGRHQADERVRHLLRQSVVRRIVTDRRCREVLLRNRVQLTQ